MRMVVGVVGMGFRTACSRMVMRHGGTVVGGTEVKGDKWRLMCKDWILPAAGLVCAKWV
jgi:hypothetical protein